MNVHFKITERLRTLIQDDLRRPHRFAAERVGFIACRCGEDSTGLVVVAHDYLPVADEHYLRDNTVGAMMSADAIRGALQHSLTNKVSIFHVHDHGGMGIPGPSRTDTREWANFVPNFWNIQPELPHGALILSDDSALGYCWIPRGDQPVLIDRFTIVGSRLRWWRTRR
ncbi:MAG: hypothetical protein JWM11_4414 [Planctomycetaceae bacterium]|nr:hypothetical protein [Planctomycetaceae bacterium]